MTAKRKARPADPSTLTHRVDQCAGQLGLSRADVAREAGMAPRYLERLLTSGADFDPAGSLRVAAVLRIPYEELVGDASPARGEQGADADEDGRPVLVRLSAHECWDRLGAHGLGRVALPVHPGPGVFPVTYAVEPGAVVYRTDPQGSAAPAEGMEVSFETDRVDDEAGEGWSVLVTGTAERVESPSEVRRLAAHHDPEPWAGGENPLWVRIRPRTVTGRRIGHIGQV